MNEYYFTFGTSELFPFKKGYIIVVADNENRAIKIFNAHYLPVHDDVVNCSFIYSEEEFIKTNMFEDYPDWDICHRILEQ